MELIPILEAARRKHVSRDAVAEAIKDKTIDCQKLGVRSMVVKVNRKFEDWHPLAVANEEGKKVRPVAQSKPVQHWERKVGRPTAPRRTP